MTISFLYPLVYMLFNALKTKPEYFMDPFSVPTHPTLSNFQDLFTDYDIGRLVFNSLFIAVVSTALIVFTSAIASYAFAKLRFRGKVIAYAALMATMFLPGQVTMIPKYVMFSKMGLIDSPWAVIISYWAAGIPGAVLLMRSSFVGIPNEVIESARIDGAGFFTILWKIVMPMGMAGIAIVIIFQFIGAWNDYLTPLLYLTTASKQTLMVVLSQMVTRYGGNPAKQFAGIFLSVIPTIVIYLCLQKYMLKGVTAGSLK
jgi:ABC-type glycerol-3-phosphate transport system permease component